MIAVVVFAAFQLVQGGVEYPTIISRQYGTYSQCLFRIAMPDKMMPSDKSVYRRRVEQAIVQCADIRKAVAADADRTLAASKEYADPGKRAAALSRTFDGADEQQRRLPEIMDAIRAERR